MAAIPEHRDEEDLNVSPAIQDARMGSDTESEEQAFDDINMPNSSMQLNQRKQKHYQNKNLDLNKII